MKIYTKIGDVFSVELDNYKKKYFQLIAFDLTQLNSDVIRAFKYSYPIEANPELSELVNGEVEFYAHCIVKIGVKLNLWKKIGFTNEIGDTSKILFRNTNDYGNWIDGKPVKISEKWYIWNINDKSNTKVGKLIGGNRNAEIGIVVNPYDIIDRLKTGKYSFVYPEFE